MLERHLRRAAGALALTRIAGPSLAAEVVAFPGAEAIDTDGDGMPDAWEKARGFDPRKADGATLAKDGCGWTNLELDLADAAKARG